MPLFFSRSLFLLKINNTVFGYEQLKCSMSGKHGPIQYPEVILCVEIYHSKASWKKVWISVIQ